MKTSTESTTYSNAVLIDQQAINIIALLGEKENIEDVDACMTSLSVTVKDIDLVSDEMDGKKLGH